MRTLRTTPQSLSLWMAMTTLALKGAAVWANAPVIVERFEGDPDAAWQLVRPSEETNGEFDWKVGEPGLWFMTPTSPVSPGMAVRPWPIGHEPFEVTWRVEILGGDGMSIRYPSIHVALTTAPPDQMKPGHDLAVVMGVGNPGVSAGVRRGPLYQLNQNPQGHPPYRSRWQDEWLPGGMMGSLSIANVTWYDNVLARQTVTVQMVRTAEGKLRFTAWHHDIGLDTPWWQAEQDVPKALAEQPLSHLVILVSPAPAGHPFHGPQSRVRGWLKDLQVRPLASPRPVITGLEPEGSVAAPGGQLVILGRDFGDQPRVILDGQPIPVIEVLPDRLRVTLPPREQARRYPLEVHHPSGTVGIWPAGVTYGRVLEAVMPREVNPAGGDEVILLGAGFGPQTVVTVNDQPAPVVERIDANRLRIRTPASPGKFGPARLQVTDNGQTFVGQPTISYAPHPYLMHRADQLESLRAKFNHPVMATWRQVILQGAEEPVDLTRLGGPNANNHPYYPWIAYLMTGEPKYRDKLLAILDVLCAQRDHEQFHIQKAVPVAVVYDSLFQELSPDQRQRMIAYLDRSLDHYLSRTARNDWWFANNPSNTITVGANGGVHAALALMHSRPDDARRAIDTGVRLIHEVYKGITDEGACIEGTLYWDYGLSQQVILGHALRQALGDDRGLLETPRLENAVRFARSQLGGTVFMFVNNDTQPFMTGVVIAADAGSRYDQPLMRWLADHVVRMQSLPQDHPLRVRVGLFTRAAFIGSAFFYRDLTPSPPNPPDLPTLDKLESVQWATLRSGPAWIGPLALNIKGHQGPLGHHKHPDKGNFQLHARGEALIITPGYYNSQPTDLNVPLIDGQAGDAGERTAAPITDLWEQGDLRGATVDATAAYAATVKARRVVRHFVMAGDDTVVVLDDLLPAEGTPGRVTAQWQAQFSAQASEAGAVIHGVQADLHIQPFGHDLEWKVEGPRPFKRSWVYRRFEESGWVQWHSVRAEYVADPVRPLVTVLSVTDKNTSPPAVRVEHAPDRVTVHLPGRQLAFTGNAEEGWQLQR